MCKLLFIEQPQKSITATSITTSTVPRFPSHPTKQKPLSLTHPHTHTHTHNTTTHTLNLTQLHSPPSPLPHTQTALHCNSPLHDLPDEREARGDLLHGVGGLHGGGHDGNVLACRGHAVREAHHAHVDVVLALHLQWSGGRGVEWEKE